MTLVQILGAVFLIIGLAHGIPKRDLYPYDDLSNRLTLDKGDDVNKEIRLNRPISYLSETYTTIYLDNNGFLSFAPPNTEYQNLQFPIPLPAIASLYSNVDTTSSGSVYFTQTNDENLLSICEQNINKYVPRLQTPYVPSILYIATWDSVGHYNGQSSKLNTFQIAISTNDDLETYVEILYPERGIEWIQAENKNGPLETELRAQAGFILPNGKFTSLPGSGTDQVKYLDKRSNTGDPGRFIFRIGSKNEDLKDVQEPESAGYVEEPLPTNCQEGKSLCDSNAECHDSEASFCCVCADTHYGNGLACIPKAVPRRMLGKANVNINGIVQHDLNYQGYIVVQDGRVYTALDQVSKSIGAEMKLISVLPGVPGWMFAIPSEGSLNGFQLTGGKAEHVAEIEFDPYNQLRVKQVFKGLDPQERLLVEVDISGRIPMMSPNTVAKLPDFIEEYTRIEAGQYRSRSKHILDFNDRERLEVSIDQTIKFKEHCPSNNTDIPPQRLTVTKSYVSFGENREVIVRLAAFYNISKASDVSDPCIVGRAQCIANSSCIVTGLSFKCVCNHGFQPSNPEHSGHDLGCVDINECNDRSHFCSENAICVNEVGSYTCLCNSGYTGDGKYCESIKKEIPPHMICQNPDYMETCQCEPGYQLNGVPGADSFSCEDIDECLNNPCGESKCSNYAGGFECSRCPFGNIMDQYGNCNSEACTDIPCGYGQNCVTDGDGRPICVCSEGFAGEPPDCYPIVEYTTDYYDYCRDCPPNTVCVQNECRCPQGYTGSPENCVPIEEIRENECQSDSDCHQNSRCAYNETSNSNSCLCLAGYYFNGHSCVISSTIIFARTCMKDECWCPPGFVDNGEYCVQSTQDHNPPKDCNTENNCHENAECIYLSDRSVYKCMCNAGYEGNGFYCRHMDISCMEVDMCHINATCSEIDGQPMCICNEGHVGDGSVCYAKSVCNEDFYCVPHSHCIFNQEKQYQECVCDDGYEKNYEECEPKQGPSCNICHVNATCDKFEHHVTCNCNDGFEGDGITCNLLPQRCDVENNCAPFADCVFDYETRLYHCKCREGYEGDGLECTEIITCRQNIDLCSEFASCVNIDAQYACKCNEGWFGNGTNCKKEININEEFLLLTKARTIIKLPLEPNSTSLPKPISSINGQNAIGIAADCVEGKVYWSDVLGDKIYKANYDGTELEDFITTPQSEGLAIDWLQRTIYWTDSDIFKILSANLDSKEIKEVITKDLSNPRGIAVHPWKRKIIWSDWKRDNPKIEWANYDGSGREILLRSPLIILPNSLTIDWDTDDLCWADAGINKNIGCINLNTRSTRTVVANLSYPFGLTSTSQKFYWTDWNTGKVHYAPKRTGAPITNVVVQIGGHDKLFGIVAIGPCHK